MKVPLDKKEQLLQEQFDQLGDTDAADVRKHIRTARRRIKRQLHKHQRDAGKQQVREMLTFSDESE
jgi:ubiquinone biosynthesis protein UbiJ